MRRRAAALILPVLFFASPTFADDASPTDVVDKLHAALRQDAARAQTLSHEDRTNALAQTVRETHALDLMAQARLGPRWSELDAAQQRALTDLMARVTAAGYVRDGRVRFDRLEAFRTMGSVRVGANHFDASGTRHVFTYTGRQVGAAWRIVDRLENGKSPVPALRKEYEAAWARGGFAAIVAALQAGLSPAAAPAAPATTATQVVARLQDALLGVMREAKQLGYAGRHRRLDPVVRETHYLAAIARLTVRRHWAEWSQAQQKEFADTFARLSVANYASKFDGFSGETFARVQEKPLGKSTVVRSVLTKSDGEKIRFDYTLRKVKGRWRILNITVDGVSDLSTKQAEYGSVLAGGGLPALLQKLRAQIRRYESGP